MCFVSRLALAWRKLNACFMLRKRMACKSNGAIEHGCHLTSRCILLFARNPKAAD
ncbi:Uncharacterised protein [Vibrio cholerae]|nr:Uncharacterised protein [Vibrio cholerae]